MYMSIQLSVGEKYIEIIELNYNEVKFLQKVEFRIPGDIFLSFFFNNFQV